MTDIGMRQLRTDLADWVRRAASGERVVITVGGNPTAIISSLNTEPMTSVEMLIASGQLAPPRRTDTPAAPRPLALWAGLRMDSILREVRGR